MEQLNSTMGMLDLMVRPAFCVKDDLVAGVNQQAKAHLVTTGAPIRELLPTGYEEYQEFSEGCLYVTLQIMGQNFGASVTKNNGMDIFVLEQEADQSELQAMALAARELREPLTSVLTVADRLFPVVSEEPGCQEQIARINRGLYQMLRVISNMSDAARYTQDTGSVCEIREVTAIFAEIFQRSAALIEQTDIQLRFCNLRESIYTLVDEEKLERAVYNILSNALKFTPKGGTIEARLTRRGHKLYLTVQDTGSGVDPKLRGSVHARYRREPTVEDSRFGIGLGMVLIRSAAAAHGGTVLMEHPEGLGARITMTMTIRQATDGKLRSNILKVDYAGERDHGLLELSDALPARLYETE